MSTTALASLSLSGLVSVKFSQVRFKLSQVKFHCLVSTSALVSSSLVSVQLKTVKLATLTPLWFCSQTKEELQPLLISPAFQNAPLPFLFPSTLAFSNFSRFREVTMHCTQSKYQLIQEDLQKMSQVIVTYT